MTRWFGWQKSSRRADSYGKSGADPMGAGPTPEGEAIGRYIDELIAEGRHAFALLRSAADYVLEDEAAPAWKALERQAALVPFGQVVVVRSDGVEALVEVPAFYLDRHAVTNREFARFVAAGCYDSLELWPRQVWPSLMQFTDRSGQPGPAGWAGGTYPLGKADHPVVGVCWYEAAAYARWVGKRLPTAAEWQKAGGWPERLGGGSCTRYPWGDLFDPARANLQPSGLGDTVPVNALPGGDTPNGIHQMTGNVWEWLEDRLDAIPCREQEVFRPWKPMRRIIGGAFDTYLLSEATCHFITGQGELDRRHNIGFRCALSADRLRDAPDGP
ncbi:MAG: SUMF1/EgtB/PvdO family nonheme iron enzyme [Isosphaeraceae bacterium]|nr:SUMF1/EgtB/PvdO family nonheme iron enzyme [Isosphaeraceae bacterium]